MLSNDNEFDLKLSKKILVTNITKEITKEND